MKWALRSSMLRCQESKHSQQQRDPMSTEQTSHHRMAVHAAVCQCGGLHALASSCQHHWTEPTQLTMTAPILFCGLQHISALYVVNTTSYLLPFHCHNEHLP